MSAQNEVSLTKRIDSQRCVYAMTGMEGSLPDKLLADCRAEIERLTQSNQSLRDQNTALDEKLAEYSERKYVPMTDEEVSIMMAEWYDDDNALPIVQYIEKVVIKRAGLSLAAPQAPPALSGSNTSRSSGPDGQAPEPTPAD